MRAHRHVRLLNPRNSAPDPLWLVQGVTVCIVARPTTTLRPRGGPGRGQFVAQPRPRRAQNRPTIGVYLNIRLPALQHAYLVGTSLSLLRSSGT
jgi:hypothetical protein